MPKETLPCTMAMNQWMMRLKIPHFIWQETVCHVASGEGDGGLQGPLLVHTLVVPLIALLQALPSEPDPKSPSRDGEEQH